ncbi:patatin-like phospholipase family protein [Clostridium disporicum]|mgnify:FL=1|jgi:NTE family protein|uniref:Phospholipase, patatin family n=1 Tax=Clostridium disporicum TaxID=84024 RepID=A0A174LUT6_9CLOT|nr:patatin-like phospholipase family protein [Clostridium disporicum]CUP27853.1 phospholipase%2C patatin family [Clostridium disporicum]
MKIGLVLAGGGARGAYQIGVWKALIELGIDKYIEVVSGTSIGAVNAMLFQQNAYEMAEEFWCNVKKEQLLPIDEKELLVKGVLYAIGAKNINFIRKYIPKALKAGTLTREGMNEFVDKMDFDAIKNSKIKGYATCTRLPDLKTEYFYINDNSVEDIKKILWATSAVPMIYDSQEINNAEYLDGGVGDNVPIQPVYGEGCNIIIVVHLANDSFIDKSLYPNTSFIEIIPEDIEEYDLKEIMGFDSNVIKQRMFKGHKDAIDKIKPIMDITRLIDKNELEKQKNEQKFVNKLNKMFNKIKNN